MNKRQQEARARLVAAKAALTEYDADLAKKKKDQAAATARLVAYAKRQPTIVHVPKAPNADVEHRTVSLASITPAWGAPRTAKEVIEALHRDKDALRISLGTGNGLMLAGATRAIRVIDKAAAKRIAKARAAMEAAQKKARDAERAYSAAQTAEFEAGKKLSPEDVATAVAKAHELRQKAIDRSAGFGGQDYNRTRLVRDVEQAEKHAAAAKAGTECPCQVCIDDRNSAERAKREAERIAALPKRALVCPAHGKVIAPHDLKTGQVISASDAEKFGIPSESIEGVIHVERWSDNLVLEVGLPVAYCPKCRLWYRRYSEVKAILERAKKEAARTAKLREQNERAAIRALQSAKKAGSTVDPAELVAGDVITTTCPHCDSVLVNAEVYAFEDDQDEPETHAYIECPECEDSFSIADLDSEVIRTKAAQAA